MQLLHALAKISAAFDDPNLISHAGLVPLAALAERAGLAASARPVGDAGANAGPKAACLAAGMAAGADSPKTDRGGKSQCPPGIQPVDRG